MPQPLLSMDMSAAPDVEGRSSHDGPREARAMDVPVHSPVHDLQHEILRAHEGGPASDSRADKAPGWVRLGLPVIVSLMLWAVIIGFIRALG